MKTVVRFFLIFLTLVDLSNRAAAQSPNWLWAKRAGGNLNDYAYSIATDGNGNVYVTGFFSSLSIVLGNDTLINSSSDTTGDIFVLKYDASGNVLWAKKSGGSNHDYGQSITADISGNVYITGISRSPFITFDSDTLTSTSGFFITKYDPSGNVLWAKGAQGTSIANWLQESRGQSIVTDSSGDVYVTGSFGSSIIFGTDTLTSSIGNAHIFIAKYDSSGSVLWARGAIGDGYAESVATDGSGNVYITGGFGHSMIFAFDTLTNPGTEDIFIAKYSNSGNLLWAKGIGGTSWQFGQSITTDRSGSVYVLGSFASDTIIFGNDTLTYPDGYDIFVAKYDASGNVLWTKRAGGNCNDFGHGIVTDASGNVYITGWFESATITFGSTTLINGGNCNLQDLFVVKYDTSGTVLWAKSTGGQGNDPGQSIAIDSSGNAYVTGYFFSFPYITFGNDTLTATGNEDIFVAKLASISTGIEDIMVSENVILIYPNPASTQLTVDNKQFTIKNVEIVDMLGKKIFQSKIINSNSEIQIDVSRFSQGIYFCKVTTVNGVQVKKFAKN